MYLTRLLLAIFFGGLAGTAGELVFLEHYEDVWQYAPLVAIALGFAVGGMRLFREALGGAMPALAPGTMILLAAIGYAVLVSRRQALASPRS